MAEPSAGAGAISSPDLLLADLHLPVVACGAAPEASFLNEAFLRFCAGPARSARRVFLLGDVFESWVGDDLGLADYPREVAALRALCDSGVEVLYQTGNRDFLLGAAFAKASGARALPDEQVENLGGIATLLAHGDQFCTEDLAYQRWRRFSRNRLAQWLFLKLSANRRRRIGGGLRDGSSSAKRSKAAAIMDVNDEAVVSAFRRHRVSRLIHGHTHRPATHEHPMASGTAQRIVLADWRPDRLEWLHVDAAGWRRECLPSPQ